jgi:GNAT superfamily N-acetyltransferase
MQSNDAGFTILRADASHLETLIPLFDAYRVFYRQRSDISGARKFVTARLGDGEGEGSVFFLALREQSGVGFTRLTSTYSSIAMMRLWILDDLYVIPAVRKSGVAKALMGRAQRHALATDSVGLTLETACDNLPAQALYESLGYEREQTFYKYNLTL